MSDCQVDTSSSIAYDFSPVDQTCHATPIKYSPGESSSMGAALFVDRGNHTYEVSALDGLHSTIATSTRDAYARQRATGRSGRVRWCPRPDINQEQANTKRSLYARTKGIVSSCASKIYNIIMVVPLAKKQSEKARGKRPEIVSGEDDLPFERGADVFDGVKMRLAEEMGLDPDKVGVDGDQALRAPKGLARTNPGEIGEELPRTTARPLEARNSIRMVTPDRGSIR